MHFRAALAVALAQVRNGLITVQLEGVYKWGRRRPGERPLFHFGQTPRRTKLHQHKGYCPRMMQIGRVFWTKIGRIFWTKNLVAKN